MNAHLNLTDETLKSLNRRRDDVDWTLQDLVNNYPWMHEDGAESVAADLCRITLTVEQADTLLESVQQTVKRYDAVVGTILAERNNVILEAVLNATGIEDDPLAALDPVLMADLDSLANGVTRQHWWTALCEWVDVSPDPDMHGVAVCTLEPDAYNQIPLFIEMRSSAAQGDDFEVVTMMAYHDTDEGQLRRSNPAGTAIAMLPILPNP